MDSVILDKAITATENTVTAMIKELAAGPGKARYHAETFVHACNALDRLKTLKKDTRAPKKKAADKQD